jgi:hypothetical protein
MPRAAAPTTGPQRSPGQRELSSLSPDAAASLTLWVVLQHQREVAVRYGQAIAEPISSADDVATAEGVRRSPSCLTDTDHVLSSSFNTSPTVMKASCLILSSWSGFS